MTAGAGAAALDPRFTDRIERHRPEVPAVNATSRQAVVPRP